MTEPLRESAVVGQQQQPLGVGIEAADMEQPLLAPLEDVAHARPTSVIGHRGVHAARLVQGQHHVTRCGRDTQPIDTDHRTTRVDPHPLLQDDLPVDLDAALVDQRLASSPATYPR